MYSEVLEEGREGGNEEVEAIEVKVGVSFRLPADTLGGEVDPTGHLAEKIYNA